MAEIRIYFSGSIRGGRSDQRLYLELIRHLKGYGNVLTEHLGDEGLTPEGEDGMTDAQIYSRDVDWIREADVVVAEVTTPSLGVGYEIAKAEEFNRPMLCLYRGNSNRPLSAMIAGNESLDLREYHELGKALELVDQFFAGLGLARESVPD
jgi:hypothetical protein